MAGEQDITPTGLWTDATPFSYDRKESVEILSLNFPRAVANHTRNCRVVLAAWPKKWAGPKTKHHILEQVAWSFQYAAGGVRPQMGLFGSPMNKSRRPGDTLQHRFLLIEVRGDWPALSSALG
eukprot:244423-Amphidinium_carterae.1